MTSILCIAFWCSILGVVYTYLGYPLLIYVCSRLFGRETIFTGRSDLPGVTLLIAAHNEEAVIEQRIQNALALDYPPERLKIVIASDGSSDRTTEICRRYADRITLMDFPTQRGKAATLNAAVEQIDTNIIVFSDANTSMNPSAIRHLTRWFSEKDTGAVCGRLVLTDRHTGRNVDSQYWKYETFLKQHESRLGGLLGANGAIYAIRRNLYVQLPEGTLVDDFVAPLLAKLHSGCRIIYDNQAIAFEKSAPDISGEYRRRVRIGTGGCQALGILWPLLLPQHGWTTFTFWSHKVLRWCCPVFMLMALLASAMLATHTLYRNLLLVQILFYAICAYGSVRGTSKAVRLLTMFAGMNLALLAGLLRWMVQSQTGIWARTQRQ